MIVDERTSSYIRSLDKGNQGVLREIEKEALEDYVPIIKKETQNLLRVLIQIKKPLKVLEVGTAVGFSAILMGESMPVEGKITTIEKYEKRIPIAKENFKRAGMENKIVLIEGDAAEVLKELEEDYDFIFMDAAKGQYINFLPMVMRLLKPGGVLVTDNVLQDGEIIQSRYGVARRNRTIHSRMREYLYAITHSKELITTVLPLGDGVTVSIKTDEGKMMEDEKA
jgi:predicted O-methyltransferase YrrM